MNRSAALRVMAMALVVSCLGAITVFSAESVRRADSGMSSERLQRVTAVLDKYIADNEISGSVSLVYRHGQLVYVQARGYQELETKTPMRRDSIFTMASMTKPITAVAAMILVEDGKIQLDEPVDKFLPELANRKVLNRPDGPLSEVHFSPRAITLRDLLMYRMGIGAPEMNRIPADAPISKAYRQLQVPEQTGDEFMKALGALPLVYEPGYQFMYQTPSLVLGVLIERVSGQPLDKFVEERIFKPLGMKDTGYWVPENKRTRLATVYVTGKTPGTLVPAATQHILARPVFPSGASGLESTADDYLKFARMMLAGGTVDGVRILSRKSVELMTQDNMTAVQREMVWASQWWREVGFGFGVQIRDRQSRLGPSPGSYNWNGSTGVAWMVDPKEDLIYLRLIQRYGLLPGGNFEQDFETAVYQSIVD